MTVTIEVINQGTLNLLKNLESLGLIHVQTSVPQDAPLQDGVKTLPKDAPNRWMRGCCKDLPGASVERFLADCRADKERELAIERRQEEERARYAAKLHS